MCGVPGAGKGRRAVPFSTVDVRNPAYSPGPGHDSLPWNGLLYSAGSPTTGYWLNGRRQSSMGGPWSRESATERL